MCVCVCICLTHYSANSKHVNRVSGNYKCHVLQRIYSKVNKISKDILSNYILCQFSQLATVLVFIFPQDLCPDIYSAPNNDQSVCVHNSGKLFGRNHIN